MSTDCPITYDLSNCNKCPHNTCGNMETYDRHGNNKILFTSRIYQTEEFLRVLKLSLKKYTLNCSNPTKLRQGEEK